MDRLFYIEIETYDGSCGDPDCCSGNGIYADIDFVSVPPDTRMDEESFKKALNMGEDISISVIREATDVEYAAYSSGVQAGREGASG